jgi:hypothetical protein
VTFAHIFWYSFLAFGFALAYISDEILFMAIMIIGAILVFAFI